MTSVCEAETVVEPSSTPGPRLPAWLPGLTIVGLVTAVAWVVAGRLPGVSSLVVGVVAGALWANLVGVRDEFVPGTTLAAKRLLRIGIVLLGLRLGLGDLADLGAASLAVVAATVAATFFGTQWLARRLGVDPDLGLLVATGYSICGASAIAAMEPNTDARREHVAAAIALVTLFGTVSMVTLPAAAEMLALAPTDAGAWIGAATHDVAQVVGAASTQGEAGLEAAVVVKLTRVALLAPLVAGVAVSRRRRSAEVTDGTRPPLLPLFVVGFLAAVLVRTSGVLPESVLDDARTGEKLLLTAAMVGLGAGVRFTELRALGPRPLVLGVLSWFLVGGVALAGVLVVA